VLLISSSSSGRDSRTAYGERDIVEGDDLKNLHFVILERLLKQCRWKALLMGWGPKINGIKVAQSGKAVA
jgi:hypothetical protein